MIYEMQVYEREDSDDYREAKFRLSVRDDKAAIFWTLQVIREHYKGETRTVRVDLFRDWCAGDGPQHEGNPTVVLDDRHVYMPDAHEPATLNESNAEAYRRWNEIFAGLPLHVILQDFVYRAKLPSLCLPNVRGPL